MYAYISIYLCRFIHFYINGNWIVAIKK